MDPSLSDIKSMLQQMTPKERQEALAALKFSALNTMRTKGKISPVPEPEEYTLEEPEQLFRNQTKTATAFLMKVRQQKIEPKSSSTYSIGAETSSFSVAIQKETSR